MKSIHVGGSVVVLLAALVALILSPASAPSSPLTLKFAEIIYLREVYMFHHLLLRLPTPSTSPSLAPGNPRT